MQSRRRFRFAFIALALGVLLVANYVLSPIIIGLPRLASACRPSVKSAFNSGAWKAANVDSGIRYGMANQLIQNRALIGLAEEHVIELLGKPTRRSVNQGDGDLFEYELAAQQQYPASCWLYPRLFPNVESWVLVIRLKNGLVAEVSIRGT
jgi:hypothetical protein